MRNCLATYSHVISHNIAELSRGFESVLRRLREKQGTKQNNAMDSLTNEIQQWLECQMSVLDFVGMANL